MDKKQFADSYIIANRDFFPSENLHLLREKLSSLPEEKQMIAQSIGLKSPIITLILSLLLGGLGIDRFYLGDILLGILKMVSVWLIIGLFWVLIDIFLCYKKSKEINFNNIMLFI